MQFSHAASYKTSKVRLCLDAPQANIISNKISLSENSKQYTAFTVPGRPLYQFTVMPFGLCNAPQTMCRLMDGLIPPDLRTSVFGYLDDVIIVSQDFETHLAALIRIAEQFRKANLTLNINKSQFCVTEAPYLGFIIGNGGISMDPAKVEDVKN